MAIWVTTNYLCKLIYDWCDLFYKRWGIWNQYHPGSRHLMQIAHCLSDAIQCCLHCSHRPDIKGIRTCIISQLKSHPSSSHIQTFHGNLTIPLCFTQPLVYTQYICTCLCFIVFRFIKIYGRSFMHSWNGVVSNICYYFCYYPSSLLAPTKDAFVPLDST